MNWFTQAFPVPPSLRVAALAAGCAAVLAATPSGPAQANFHSGVTCSSQ